jgi:hypothetical protein
LTKDSKFPAVGGSAATFIYKSEIYLVQLFIIENQKFECLMKWNPKTKKNSYVETTGNVPCRAVDPLVCLHKDTLYYMSKMNHELFKLNLETLHWTFIDYDWNQRPFPYAKSLSFLNNELIILGNTMYEDLEGFGKVSLEEEYVQDSTQNGQEEEPEMDTNIIQHFLRRRFGDDEDAINEFLKNEKEQTIIVRVSQ